jgi:hypothetical protein
LPRPALICLLVVAALWVVCLSVMGYFRFVEHLPYPYNFPVLIASPFADFTCFTARFKYVHTAMFFSHDPALGIYFEYPAPAALLYLPFEWGHSSLKIFLVVMYGLSTFLWWQLRAYLIRLRVRRASATWFVIAMYALSYPFWFELFRANVEIGVFLLLAVGVWTFLRGHLYWAAILFGIAASMKIFPFIFLTLFIPMRRWLQLLVGIVAGVVSNLCCLWLLCPSIGLAYRGINAGLAKNRAEYMLRFDGVITGFDHSIFGFVKSLVHTRFPHYVPPAYVTVYMSIVACIGIALYFGRIVKLPALNQIVCLYICAILLPPTSFEYTLLHMYVPWALLLLYAVSAAKFHLDSRGLLPAFLCLGVLMGPETELIRHSVLYAAQVKCIALSLLLLIAVTNPWRGLEEIWAVATGSAPAVPYPKPLDGAI